MADKSPFDLHSPIDWLKWIGRNAKRMLIFILGVSVLLAGVAMLALPGPGVVVIIVGLVILATEFTWAERALDKTTEKAAGAATKVTGNKNGQLALAASGIGMIVAGVLVAVFFSNFVIVGISIAIAGGIGLGTLQPKVQRWIDEKANTPSN
jgi:uncharacterized protein (TIGR02611 family)